MMLPVTDTSFLVSMEREQAKQEPAGGGAKKGMTAHTGVTVKKPR